MFLYRVSIDNGCEFEDWEEVTFLIAAYSLQEAREIAVDLYRERYYYRSIGDVYLSLVTKTDNGFPIGM